MERLEDRTLLANPYPLIVAVQPTEETRAPTALPIITVQYSEPMVTGGTAKAADNPVNYRLFDSAGNRITIDSIAWNATTNTATLSYNSGNILPIDAYTLFVRGDQVYDLDATPHPLSGPGQLVVANSAIGNVSVVDSNYSSGLLGSLANVPAEVTVGTSPSLVAFANLSGSTASNIYTVSPQLGTTSFTLTFGNASTIITYSATVTTSADVQTALEGLSTLGKNHVDVLGQIGGPYTVTVDPDFTDTLTGVKAAVVKTPIQDLIIVNDGVDNLITGVRGTSSIMIFQGRQGGGFDPLPTASLNVLRSASGPAGVAQIAIADINKDGAPDIAIANRNRDTATVYINDNQRGTISFPTTGKDYAVDPGGQPNGVALADMDADGNVDLMISNSGLVTRLGVGGQNVSEYNITAWNGIGDGTFQNNVIPGITGLQTRQMQVGSTDAGQVANPWGLLVPGAMVAADFDQSGTPDLAVVGDNGIGVLVNANAGTIQFSYSAYPAPTFPTYRPDCVLTTPPFANIYPSDQVPGTRLSGCPIVGADNISEVVGTVGATSAKYLDVVVGNFNNDFDKNGNPIWDMAGLTATGFVDVFLNKGQGVGTAPFAFAPSANLAVGTAGKVAGKLAVGDLNGDGYDDILVTNNQVTPPGQTIGSGLQVLINSKAATGVGFITSTAAAPTGQYDVVGQPLGVAVGDTNQDGVIDVVTAGQEVGSVTNQNLYLDAVSLLRGGSKADGTPTGTFVLPADYSNLGPYTLGPTATGDVNDDGVPDLVQVLRARQSGQADQVAVFLAKAPGDYSNPFSLYSLGVGKGPVGVALGDMDNDGNPDIAVADQTSNQFTILYNNKSPGTFGGAKSFAVGQAPTGIALGDFDVDGQLDVAVSHNSSLAAATNRGVSVSLNLGQRAFETAAEVAQGTFASALAVTDFNRDGVPDILVADNKSVGKISVLYGNGFGAFPFSRSFTTVDEPSGIALGDFNRDGYPDALVLSQSASPSHGQLSVMLSSFGTGFKRSVATDIVPGLIFKSIAVTNVNGDAFPDAVVTVADEIDGQGSPRYSDNNVYTLLGNGDGSFSTTNFYQVGGPSGIPPPLLNPGVPNFASVINDPFMKLTTFETGGTIVNNNLLRNASFEKADLTGEKNNLSGWTAWTLTDTHGRWGATKGPLSPISLTTVNTPRHGLYAAMADQANLNLPWDAAIGRSDYSGTRLLYQDINIPANATNLTFSLLLYLNSFARFTDPGLNPLLDYQTPADNQQVRIDLVVPPVDPPSDSRYQSEIIDVKPFDSSITDPRNPNYGSVLKTLFLTDSNTARSTPYLPIAVDLTGDLSLLAGKTVRLRIAAVNNINKLIVGVDNVQLRATYDDSKPTAREPAPVVSGLKLRNPGVGVTTSFAGNTTDPTIAGFVTDDSLAATIGSPNNIYSLAFDTNGNGGFNDLGDITTSDWDALGNFALTLDTVSPGITTVGVKATDKAGNAFTTSLTFNYLGGSKTIWSALGPAAISTADLGVKYPDMSGRVTAIAVDPRDASGNTYFVGSANGGVWKTTNGGQSWTPLTDHVVDPQGQPINVSVGGMALDPLNPDIIYVATGIGDNQFDSRPGIGVIKSVDGGRTWFLVGNSGSVLNGARVTKLAVGADIQLGSNYVYVAVASGGASGPGVYRSTDGGLTWVNVLSTGPNGTMTDDQGNPITGPLAPVTDLLIDPFDSTHITIGLGNLDPVLPPPPPPPPLPPINLSANGGAAEEAFPIDTGATSGTISLDYDMVSVPDRLTIYAPTRAQGGALIFDSGLVSGSGTVNVNYTSSTGFIEIVMNEGGGQSGTVWDLTNVVITPAPPPPVVQQDKITGVWVTGTRGNQWQLLIGGKDPLVDPATNKLPTGLFDANRVSPGPDLGRITLAQGRGRVGDERTLYVLIANPGAATLPGQHYTGNFQSSTSPAFDEELNLPAGLYKSKDYGLNWTRVRLRENIAGPASEDYQDINILGGEASDVGSMIVDPNNPAIVYVGGSRRYADNINANPQSQLWPGFDSRLVHGFIRVDTTFMRDTTYTGDSFVTNRLPPGSAVVHDTRSFPFGATGGGAMTAPYLVPNDGDDIEAYDIAFDNQTNPAVGCFCFDDKVSYFPVGVAWVDLEANNVFRDSAPSVTDPKLSYLPTGIHALAFDAQGRLLVGTERGIWRGVDNGFKRSSTGLALNGQPMSFTSLNSNLQISSLTSVAIDPTDPRSFYTSEAGTGTARTDNGLFGWATMGVSGPIDPVVNDLYNPDPFPKSLRSTDHNHDLKVPDGAAVRVGVPVAGSSTQVYRAWAFANPRALITEYSIFGGDMGSFDQSPAIGQGSLRAPGIPPMAISPVKVFNNNQFYDQLIFGTDRVFRTDTGARAWTDIVGRPLSTIGGLVTALTFANTTQGGVYAGTDKGEVFVTLDNGQDAWPLRNAGLPAVPVNGLTANPNNPLQAWAMMGGGKGISHVYQTLDGGVSWKSISGNLPDSPANTLVYNSRNGRLFVGTDVGVYASSSGGKTWNRLGQGLPNAPVVDLQFNTVTETLAAATGRGIFTISSDLTGPRVASVSPNTPVNAPLEAGTTPPLNAITVNFNEALDSSTMRVSLDEANRSTIVATPLVRSSAYNTILVKQFYATYLQRQPTVRELNAGVAGKRVGKTNETLISGIVGSDEYFATRATSDLTTWVNTVYMDLLGRAPTATELSAALTTYQQKLTTSPSKARTTTAYNIVLTSDEYRTILVTSYYNKYLHRPPTASETSAWVGSFQLRGTDETVIAGLLGSLEYYRKNGAATYVDANLAPPVSGLPALDPGAKPVAVALGDMNADGFLDVVSANNGSNTVTIFYGGNSYSVNLGSATGGTFTLSFGGKSTRALSVSASAADVLAALAPLPGVGFGNVAVTGGAGTFAVTFAPAVMGALSGTFTRLTPTQTTAAVVNTSLPPTVLTLPSLPTVPPTTAKPQALVLESLSGGALDIIVADSGTNNVAVFLNQGGGTFVPASKSPYAAGNSPSALLVADFNGDGIKDIITGDGSPDSLGNYNINILRGLGGGDFGAPTSFNAGVGGINGLAQGDLGGGTSTLPEVVVAGVNGLQVLINDSTAGTFVVARRSTYTLVLGTQTAGTFTLTFNGQTTPALAFNATAAAIQSALQALSSVGAGNATVTGAVGGPFTISFAPAVGAVPPGLSANFASLSNPGNATLTTVQTAPLSTLGTNSVALGTIDGDTTLDIVASNNFPGGVIQVYQNRGALNFTPAANGPFYAGARPFSVTLRDLNGDGRNDVLVANNQTNGTVTALLNTTVAQPFVTPDPVSFSTAVSFGTGGNPTSLAVGDINQDLNLDVVTANSTTDDLWALFGYNDGSFQGPTDASFITNAFLDATGSVPSARQMSANLRTLAAKAQISISGPRGTTSPLEITSVDPSNPTSWQMIFAPQTFDGTYTVTFGTKVLDVAGNPMNQNANGRNGEARDRGIAKFVVNSSDTGRLVTGLTHDLLNRSADTTLFLQLLGPVDKALNKQLNIFAKKYVKEYLKQTPIPLPTSAEGRTDLIKDIYTQFLGRLPLPAELPALLKSIARGVESFLVSVLKSPEYFTRAGNTNLAWLTHMLSASQLNLTTFDVSNATLVLGAQTAGIFRLTFNGKTTGDLNFNATNVEIQAALEGLTTIGTGNVTVTGAVGGPFTIALSATLPGSLTGKFNFLSAPRSASVTSGEYRSLLNSYLAARQKAADTVLVSTEYLTNLVTGWYDAFLKREPTTAEVNARISQLRARGALYRTVIASLVGSQEYFLRIGVTTNAQWLAQVFPDLLGRAKGPFEGAQLIAALDAGATSRTAVATTLLTTYQQTLAGTPEYRTNVIQGYYTNLLLRTASAAELQAWLIKPNFGPAERTLLSTLLGSNEYFDLTHLFP